MGIVRVFASLGLAWILAADGRVWAQGVNDDKWLNEVSSAAAGKPSVVKFVTGVKAFDAAPFLAVDKQAIDSVLANGWVSQNPPLQAAIQGQGQAVMEVAAAAMDSAFELPSGGKSSAPFLKLQILGKAFCVTSELMRSRGSYQEAYNWSAACLKLGTALSRSSNTSLGGAAVGVALIQMAAVAIHHIALDVKVPNEVLDKCFAAAKMADGALDLSKFTEAPLTLRAKRAQAYVRIGMAQLAERLGKKDVAESMRDPFSAGTLKRHSSGRYYSVGPDGLDQQAAVLVSGEINAISSGDLAP